MRYVYHSNITENEDGTFTLQYYDIPEATMTVDSRHEAVVNATDLLMNVIETYMELNRIIPTFEYPDFRPDVEDASGSLLLSVLETGRIKTYNRNMKVLKEAHKKGYL